jgi:hypothetical protein
MHDILANANQAAPSKLSRMAKFKIFTILVADVGSKASHA